MADVDSFTGNDLRDLLLEKPGIMARLIGITIDESTMKNEHWINVHPGKQKLDFVFQDTEGKHYTVKVALGERPLSAVRIAAIWAKRWAEINELDEDLVVPVLLVDEETVNADPRAAGDLKEFPHVTSIQYKIADMVKEVD